MSTAMSKTVKMISKPWTGHVSTQRHTIGPARWPSMRSSTTKRRRVRILHVFLKRSWRVRRDSRTWIWKHTRKSFFVRYKNKLVICIIPYSYFSFLVYVTIRYLCFFLTISDINITLLLCNIICNIIYIYVIEVGV